MCKEIAASPATEAKGANRVHQGVAIVGWTIDSKQYRATPMLSDGNEGPALELLDLFKQFHEEADG